MNKPKVLLINPPTGIYIREDRCQTPIVGHGVPIARPPMDLAYMAACLEQIGAECIIKDYPMEKACWDDIKAGIRKISPDYLILSVTTPTLNEDLKACDIAKEINPGIITIAKGADFFESWEGNLMDYKNLDIAIRGECEFAAREIIEAIEKKKPLKNVKGIAFRQGSMAVKTKDRPYLTDLDSLPFPARHLLNNSLYTRPDTREPVAVILNARGCPYNCIYCLVGLVSGKAIHSRSVKSTVDELEECVKRHKIKNFFFRADTFTFDKKWAIDVCREILKRGLKINWVCNSRVDTIDDERLQWMKKAGCYLIAFGAESGNQEILMKMKKGITLEQTRNAVALCKKHGIKTYLFFILGLPWEDEKTINDTINFAKELNPDLVDFSLAYPFPGTELYEIAQENNLMADTTLRGYNYNISAAGTMHLSNEQLQKLKGKALRSFYFRPGYILKLFSQARSPREFANLLSFGARQAVTLFRL